MTFAFTSHLDVQQMTTRSIVGGLVRITCDVCDHIAIAEGNNLSGVGTATVPAWMQAAADRFAASSEPELSIAAV